MDDCINKNNPNTNSKSEIEKLLISNFFQNQRLNDDFHIKFQDIEFWKWLIELYDDFLLRKNNHLIVPKKIHQVWIGSKIPKKYQVWGNSWKINHPNFEYFLWDEKKILNLGLKNEKQFRSAKNVAIKSDIARYEILNRFGGMYIDTDFECIKPLDPKFLTYDFVAGQIFSYAPQIANGLMISTKNNFILNNVIENLGEYNGEKTGMDVIKYSGAIYLTKTIKNLKDDARNIVLMPSQYFYPWPNFLKNEKNFNKFFTDNSFGVHHWEVSWLKKNMFQKLVDYFRNKL